MSNSPAESGQRRERFLFLGSGLLLLTVVLLGFAKAQRWGTSFIEVYIKARDVNGLTRGEDIRIAGIPVGQVGDLRLNKKGKVDVQLQIETDKAYLIGPRSKAHLSKEGLIGDPFLVISADPRPEDQGAAINGSSIPFQEPVSVDSLLKQLSSTQKELQATLRNTTALTASNGSLKATLDATHQLAKTMSTQMNATAPVMREAMGSVAADVHAVSESTEAVEKETLSLIRETRPLVEQTIKDTDELTRSSKQVIDLLHSVLGPWLEPADGHKPEPH